MSIMIMSRLFKMNLGGCNRKLLAIRLADFADDEGRGIYPSVARLAAETEMSERTIQRILSEFVKEGILVIVRGATGRPGVANDYSFDLDRLYAYKPGETGDRLSPVDTIETGDNPAETGDTGDIDGCHGDTRTVIEPPIEPSIEREGAREIGRNDRKMLERRFWRIIHDWPGIDGMPKDEWLKEWMKLSDDERDRAESRRDAWLKALRDAGRSHVHVPGTYFRKKLFDEIPEPKAIPDVPLIHNPFSRAWTARRLAELCKPAEVREPMRGINATWAEERDEDGRLTDRALRTRREHQARYGWQVVRTMDEWGQNAKGRTVPAWLVAISEGFQRVKRDSELASRWEEFHEAHGWPWMTIPKGVEWLFLPPGEPETAMMEFRAEIARERGNDDAA